MTKYTAFIIEDHPLIIEAYKSAFNFLQEEGSFVSFDIITANNCDSAIEIIEDFSKKNKNIDIIFLDISLPPSKDKKILSGEDLGLKIKKLLPKSKIIISTSFNDNYRIYSIFKNINPEGFLIKNDITPKELVTAIKEVIKEPPYYSKTVSKLLRNQLSNNFSLDDIDRKILHELSIGTKIKDLPKIVHLSISGIEKRRLHLKQVFNINGESDRELILIAKEKGFI
ncbi:response regulator [Polaribacter sp. Asnod1-A03]|uniref:response regulator n=1 Tax=Polaribacter sp. Asnod1-A03 TaxID=3160581 RepID=UPI00386AEEAD